MGFRYVLGTTVAFVCAFAGSVSVASSINRAADVKAKRAVVYHGRIVRPDGTLPTGILSVSLRITSPEPALCVLWAETQDVQMEKGTFSTELGHLANRVVGTQGGAAVDFRQVFVNNAVSFTGAQCAEGTTYSPAATDDRLLFVSFNDNGTPITIAGLPIKSVPYAMQAEEVGGFGVAKLARISGAGSAVEYTPAEIQTLKDLLGGDLFFDMKSRAVRNVLNPSAPQDAATKAYVDAGLAASAVLPMNQVFIGSGASVAAAGYFGLGNLRNGAGAQQFPASCSSSQTLTWSAITDVLTCANIDGLNADKITAGTLAVARIPALDSAQIASGTLATARLASGAADATKYLRGDGTWQTLPNDADNLGNHVATQNVRLGAHWLSGDGGNEGVAIDSGGLVGIGTQSPAVMLDVRGAVVANAPVNSGAGPINFGTGNLQYTDNDCAAYALHNMKNGGSYSLSVKGAGVATCAFTAYTGTGSGALTMHMPLDHGPTTASKHTLYSFVVIGGDVYVSWIPGL